MQGIDIVENKIYCAECKKALTDASKPIFSFCPFCGNPLNSKAIEKREEEFAFAKIQTIRTLNKIAKENKTDSFKQIVETYSNENL